MSTVPWTKAEQQRIVHTFAFDEPAIAEYMGKFMGRNMCFWTALFPPYCITPLFCGYCFLKWGKENGEEFSHCVYVALSNEGIMYCEKKHKNYCQYWCCDSGEVKKFIPYEKILDMQTISPAGGWLTKETLYQVQIQTAANSGGGQANIPELTLFGLVDHEDFVEKVRGFMQGKKREDPRAQEPGQMAMEITKANGNNSMA